MEDGPYKYIRVRQAEKMFCLIQRLDSCKCAGVTEGHQLDCQGEVLQKERINFSFAPAGWEWQGYSGHPDRNPQKPGKVLSSFKSEFISVTLTLCTSILELMAFGFLKFLKFRFFTSI